MLKNSTQLFYYRLKRPNTQGCKQVCALDKCCKAPFLSEKKKPLGSKESLGIERIERANKRQAMAGHLNILFIKDK